MLGFIGNAPINSLSSAGRIGENAQAILITNKSNELQREWWFNTNNVTLSPDIDGNIYVPENAIEVIGSDIQVLGDQIFSITNESFTFDASIDVQVVSDLDWNDLPFVMQYYVAIVSTRDLYATRFPKNNIPNHLQEKFIRAESDVTRMDLNSAKYNFGENKDIVDIINK
jgi:hypothetical protein